MHPIDWKTCAAILAGVALLALSFPGVKIVRADQAPEADGEVAVLSVGMLDSGSICDPTAAGPVAVHVTLDASDDGSHAIALNNQGYSYRAPNVDPEARRLEQR